MAKAALLDAINTTRRGSAASRDQRGVIEELQVRLERIQQAQRSHMSHVLLPAADTKCSTLRVRRYHADWSGGFSGCA